MARIFLILYLSGAAWVLAQSAPATQPTQLSVICYKNARDEALVDAIAWCRRHAEVLMTTDLLRSVIDDEAFGATHRRRCYVQAWALHVKTPTKLSRLAEVFGYAKWANAQTIEVLGFATGQLPIQVNLEDTIFVVRPRFSDQDPLEVYVRVRGKMSINEFLAAFTQEPKGATAREVLEIGFGNLDAVDRLLTQ